LVIVKNNSSSIVLFLFSVRVSSPNFEK